MAGSHFRAIARPRSAALAVLVLLAFGVGLASLRYLSGDPGVAPPAIQASFIANGWIFLSHALASAVALMLGALQLLSRSRRWGWHRWGGRVYVAACVAGGLSALWIAPDVESGWVATVGFSALAVAWIGATVLGWRHAVGGRFDLHRRWMLRSYALTGAAITLRLQLVVFSAFGLDYGDVSAVLGFSCWLPNLVLVEAYLARRRRVRAGPVEA